MRTLVELIPEMKRLGKREAVLHVGGYRSRRWSYEKLYRHISGVALTFEDRDLGAGDRILLWGENRPEWLAVFWAALARGITVVPIDYRSSSDFVATVQAEVTAKLLVHGAGTTPSTNSIDGMTLESVGSIESPRDVVLRVTEPDDIVQVLYTSGTTGVPKGVVHRHRHLVANLAPIRTEIRKYAWIAKPFQPIRILGLVPTSHVFGQFTAVFVPIVLGGAVTFMEEMHPAQIIETIRRERISVLSTVPRMISGLRRELERRHPRREREGEGTGLAAALVRFWQHRALHGELGWKFWAILSGGARLPAEDEAYFWQVSLALVQGYGLTETSSVVATNHPFRPKRGALGEAVGEQRIELGEDGEILVRGENVSLEYYGEEPSKESGWFHTGDIGEIREDGLLYYVGRKKDVIVGADGMNVHPEDVERALNRQPEVKEAVVVGRETDGGDRVHAVLLSASGDSGLDEAVQRANGELEEHQRIKAWSLWPDADFPRTSSTLKIRRHEVRTRLGGDAGPREPPASGTRALLASRLGKAGDTIDGSLRLSEELGLTSLDRVELLTDLERELGRELSETAMAHVDTVEQLERFVAEAPPPQEESRAFGGIVRHSRRLPVRAIRTAFRETVIRPLFHHYLPLTVTGDVAATDPPVIFAANHQSNLDTLALLTALPPKHRSRIAPAIHQGYFDAYLDKTGTLGQRLSFGAQYWLAVILAGVFPLPRGSAASRRSLRFAGALVDEGHSILIFPEGQLSRDGAMAPFQPGVGLLAIELQVPVIPVHIDGLFEAMSYRDRWPKARPVRLSIGAPMRFHESDKPEDATRVIESAVRALA